MKLKTGYSLFSFDSALKDLPPYLSAIQKAGYDGVELILTEEGALNLHSTDAEILALKRQAQDFGLEIPSVGCMLHWAWPLTASDKAVRSKAMHIITKQLDAAALLGADTILLVPGYVGCDFVPNSELVPYDVAYERALEGIKALSGHAEKNRVSIGIENVWNKFLLSPLELKALIEQVDSPFVGAYFDVGNIIYNGYPEQWIRILGKHIKKIHFSDFKYGSGQLSGFCDLLAGSVDFCAVMTALREIGYSDYITLEMLPNYAAFPMQSIYSNKPSLDFILGLGQ